MKHEYPKELTDLFDEDHDKPLPSSYQNALDNPPSYPERAKFAHANWVVSEIGIPWLQLDIPEFDHKALFDEALALKDEAVFHRDAETSGGYGHRGWSSLTLHGLHHKLTQHWDSDAAREMGIDYIKDEKEANELYDWTAASEKCPQITQMLKDIFLPGYRKFHRVRIMYLEPGGYVLPHTDGSSDKLSPINIALNNPKECMFKMVDDDAYVPYEDGTAFKLNIGPKHNHAVMNDSDELRIHIIIHGEFGGVEYENLILNSWEKFYK